MALRTRPQAWLLPVLVALFTLTSCGEEGRPDPATAGTAASHSLPASGEGATSSAPDTTAVTTVVVVGDSITAGIGGTDSAESPGENSWIPAADRDPLDFIGGWAVPGTTTPQMSDGVTAMTADLLVVMAGTNDLQQGLPWSRTRADLVSIVQTADVPHTVLLAIPPFDARSGEVAGFNERVAQLAHDRGWGFFDPWVDVSVGGAYVPGATSDGVHPSPAAAADVGSRIRAALLQDDLY